MSRRPIAWALFAVAALGVAVLAPDDQAVVEPVRAIQRTTADSAQRPRPPVARTSETSADAGLTILAIRRRERDSAGANPFPAPSVPARPRPVVRVPPPQPVAASAPPAPPLPFQVMGRFVDDKREAVFLMHGDQTLVARVGDTLAGSYQVESLSPSALTLMYIPLGLRQTLPIAPSP